MLSIILNNICDKDDFLRSGKMRVEHSENTRLNNVMLGFEIVIGQHLISVLFTVDSIY